MIEKKKNNWPRFWLLLVCFGLIPACLLQLGWNFFVEQRLAVARGQESAAIRKELRDLRREGADRVFLQKRLNALYGMLSEENLSPALIERFLARMKHEGLGFIKFRFFDQKRMMQSLAGDSDKNRVIIQRIFSALSQPETEGASKLLDNYRSFFEAFLGGISPAEVAYDKSTLLRVSTGGKPGYFYWNTFYDMEGEGAFRGGMVAYFLENEIPQQLALKALIAAKNQEKRSGRLFGLADLAHPEQSVTEGLAGRSFRLSARGTNRQIMKMRREFVTEEKIAGHLLTVEPFDANRFVYCLSSGENSYFQILSLILKIAAMLMLMVVARIAFVSLPIAHEVFCRQFWRFSMWYAVLIPLLAFILVGYQYTASFRQVMYQDVRVQLAGHIENVDENYEVAVNTLADTYRRLSRLKMMCGPDQQKLADLVAELKKKDALQRFFLLDRDGKLLFQWPEGRSENDFIKKLVPTIGRRIYASHLAGEQSFQNKVSDMMVESLTDSFSEIIGDSRAGFFKNFETLDQINEFWFANRRYYVFSTFVEQPSAKDPYLMFIWHGTATFSERYLLKQVKRNSAASQIEHPIRLAMVPRQRTQPPFPREFNKYPFSQAMSEQVLGTEAQQYSVEEMGGESWLVVASPLKRIPGFLLFAMYPMRLIDETVLFLSLKILITALASCIAVFCLGKVCNLD